MNQTIFISGTPTVGKTTISEVLASKIGAKLIKINDFVFENGLTLGKDSDKGYEVIDIEKLDAALQEELEDFDGTAIVEGHVSHLCSNADKIIVLRANPEILRERLEARGYGESKIRENLEAEALGVCGCEAYDMHSNKVEEVDVSSMTVEDAVEVLEDIIEGNVHYPFGNIDFMEWIISN
ncbi:MAG: adenylate kinase family protein [Methanobrevibacter sp.]|uniref:adenylate kinase family protein n=1 Tax=Methanobrevibacter sp. TaxID=66852 RepID=UPI0026E0FB92|nr:adenylate kinase family protein [Methanobrevibacter sp.]MDO5848536.1 adenylate kinase family protein [Methanobrevibacter sp.]